MARQRTKAQALRLDELDQQLDGSVAGFPRQVQRLIKRFRDQDQRFEIPESRTRGAVAKVQSGRQYEAELARLPQMERAEEFRMARRYEFFRERLAAALRGAGVPRAEIPGLLSKGATDLPALPRPAREPYVRRAWEELEKIRNLYVEGSLHLVLSSAYRYRGLGVDLGDLIQEGNASLFQAIEGFDWRRDVRFRTYAQYWVHQAVLKALYNSSRTVRIPVWVQKTLRKAQRIRDAATVGGLPPDESLVADELGIPLDRLEQLKRLRRSSISLDAPLGAGGEDSMADQLADPADPVEAREDIDVGERLAEGMASLPERQRLILRRRFGLEGSTPETLGEIAVDLGITAERVRQLQNTALQRLQGQRSLQMLAEL